MCLMPEKENRESILTTFKLSMGSAYETQNNQSELVIGDPTFNIKVNTELSRINGKMLILFKVIQVVLSLLFKIK